MRYTLAKPMGPGRTHVPISPARDAATRRCGKGCAVPHAPAPPRMTSGAGPSAPTEHRNDSGRHAQGIFGSDLLPFCGDRQTGRHFGPGERPRTGPVAPLRMQASIDSGSAAIDAGRGRPHARTMQRQAARDSIERTKRNTRWALNRARSRNKVQAVVEVTTSCRRARVSPAPHAGLENRPSPADFDRARWVATRQERRTRH